MARLSASEYLKEHDVEAAIARAISQIIRERPVDPIAALSALLQTAGATAAVSPKPTLLLFDVDGTLAVPAQKASDATIELLAKLRARGYLVGIVGAGDFDKQEGQLGGTGLRSRLDFCFSENGVHAFRGETLLHQKSIVDHMGSDRWREFESGLNELRQRVSGEAEALLREATGNAEASISDRGTFLERRMCTCNVCVIGRTPALSKAERAAYDAADRADGLRARVVAELTERFGPATPYALSFSIGGQIGIDCAPCGWDKTFCLRFLPEEDFPSIHFFGDKTEEGGGDHELYEHSRTIGHTVTSPEHTAELCTSLFLS